MIRNRRYWNEMSLQVAGRECISSSNIYSSLTSLLQLRLRQERPQHEHFDGIQVLRVS